MKNTGKAHFAAYCGLFCALGILFPMIFHAFGAVSGQTFLPMHIPVLIAGLLISPLCGLVSGILSPALSCLLTNMPIPVKMPFMCIELAVYGLSSGLFMHLFTKKLKSRTAACYISLICAQILGRIANLICTFAAINIFGITSPAISVKAALASIPLGFLGIVIQWLIIPPAVNVLSKIARHKK